VYYAGLLFPDFSLILCGLVLCRYTSLNRTVWAQVESLVYFFLFPVLLFGSIVKSPLDLQAATGLILAAVSLSAVGIFLAHALPWLPWLRRHINRRDHAASAQIGFRFNTFVALALTERLLGTQGLVLIAVVIGVCVPLLNAGAVWPMARQGGRGVVAELVRNPLVIGTVAGLAANLLGFSMPHWLEPTTTRIGAAALALGLMATGAGLQFAALAQNKVLGASLLAIRHLWLPLVAWALARVLELPPDQRTVLLIFSSVPTASSAYVLAARMGYNGAYVAGLVTLSTLLGLVSLPLALGLLRSL